MTRPVLHVPVTGNLTEAGAASLALLRGSPVLTLRLFRDQQILEAAALGLSGDAMERFGAGDLRLPPEGVAVRPKRYTKHGRSIMSNTTQIARPVDTLRTFLEKPSAATWLEKQLHRSMNRSAADLINVVLHSAAQNDKLARCTGTSILAALVSCAQLGLVPNTRLGHAYLVPFGNRRKVNGTWTTVDEAQLVIGYQGLVLLMHGASGATIQAAAVRANDSFSYNLAADHVVDRHVYADKERGELTAAYAIAKLKGGGRVETVLTRQMVEARRDRSAGWKFEDGRAKSPWTTDTEAMWRKTAVRALAALVPMGPDSRMSRALELEDMQEREEAPDLRDLIEMPAEIEAEYREVEAKHQEERAAEKSAEKGSTLDALTGGGRQRGG